MFFLVVTRKIYLTPEEVKNFIGTLNKISSSTVRRFHFKTLGKVN